jgi:glycosyltransferase involved in cell wall biosynthesis
MEGIFTTCKQNKEAFINSGVTVPIYVYYHGINPKDYPFINRPEDPVWVFGTLGRLSVRKGTDLVVKAFKEEFKTERDVALILKSSDALVPFEGISNLKTTRDPRITVIGEVLSHEKKLELYKTIDCFVFPSRGEGFGLPPLEAMATGLPVIMTNWAGLSEFGNVEDTMLLDYKMTKAENFTKQIYKEDCGYWSEPNFEQLKKYMRWSYEHRKESREMGEKSSKRINKDWTWDKVTNKFIKQINKII